MRALLLCLAITACTASSGPSVRDYVDTVTTVDGTVHAKFVSGALPHDVSGPPSVGANPDVIPGGTAPVTLTAASGFSTAIVAVDGVDGYFEIDLVPGTTTVQLLVTLSQDLGPDGFILRYGIGDGATFGFTPTPVTVVPVGTGQVQVSLSWSTQADVDLHVVDPTGEEIYWLSRNSASGGMLDLDSNAACGSDGPRNENITWPLNDAPAGEYKVLVDYWSNCGAAATPFVVTVNVKGRDATTFTGTFTGSGDMGGPGAGQPITTFLTNAGDRSSSAQHLVGTFAVEPGPVTYVK